MDIEFIKELICMVERSNLSLFQLETNEYKIYMTKGDSKNTIIKESNQRFNWKITGKLLKENIDETCCTIPNDNLISTLNRDNKKDGVKAIKSLLVGVFYNYVSKENDFQLRIGSKVRKGEILCIIIFLNIPIEIKSDIDGEIIDICVNEGQIVEYGQILFKVRF
ncbi:hypothetical protein LGL55_15695 [Clostridium tagluense]|uniref:acetyl-CoA carboxylase biotin carboxyl carrier protein n=1 Tax=Clostridium tagluense TaxID=360422 RepID=UPI001CF1B617|nr:biotin/lipoyl-containing protein [Clostridium tagluense]MCB2312718.1 hypothetical protein [Clostridium tagluense]MCB2317485.1 hypothetical protein [Clostridium tagluense]MCB2322283.1 hypothetical protein [Clostridium tagluense]MCB2327288.1 hypothetical protein [Clostridium tagluense]MCB2331986.1 hypothetical protein [Clostridium tagluense]